MRRQACGRLSKYEPNAIAIGNPPTPSNMYLGVPKQFHTKILAADMEFLALVFHQILVLASEKVPSGCPSPAQHSLSGGIDISGEGASKASLEVGLQDVLRNPEPPEHCSLTASESPNPEV